MMIMAMAVSSMLVTQQRETNALSEKFSSMDFERTLFSAMSDGNTCNYILNTPATLTFDITKPFPQYLTPSEPIYASVIPGSPPTLGPVIAAKTQAISVSEPNLVVDSITLEIVSGAGNTYLGKWKIGFDSSKLVRGLRPVEVSTTLFVDSTTPSQTKVVSCMTGDPIQLCLMLGGTVINGVCENYVSQNSVAIFNHNDTTLTLRNGPSGSIVLVSNGSSNVDPSVTQSFSGSLQGARCDWDSGWRLSGCFGANHGDDLDLVPYAETKIVGAVSQLQITGCMTDDSNGLITIQCFKNIK
jgi:hypothetical protein